MARAPQAAQPCRVQPARALRPASGAFPSLTALPSVHAALPSREFRPQRVRVFLDYMTAQTPVMLAAIEAGAADAGHAGP